MAIAQTFDDEVLNSIIKRSLISAAPKDKTEELTKKQVVEVSNTITSLHNAFNKIYAYTLNVKNIHKLEEKRLQNIKKEVTMETKTSTATFAGGMSVEIGNLPDIFKQLTKSVEELTKNLDKLDMSSQTGDATVVDDDDDDDTDRRRRRRGGRRGGRGGGRGRGRRRGLRGGRAGLLGRILGPAAALLDISERVSDDESAGQIAAGVGGGVVGGAAGAKVGAAIGAFGGPAAPVTVPLGALVGGALGYVGGSMLGDTAYEAATNNGSERQLTQAATNVTRQQAKLEKGKPLGSTSFSSRFANYLDQSINNMAQWAMTASPMLAAMAAAARGAMSIFSPNIGDLTLSGDTRADFQTIMDMAAAAGAPRPEIVAAQWALESGWGRHMSGRNNPFGQKATESEPGTVRSTREVINGQSVYVNARFKDYASLQDAIAEHVRRWNARYTTAEMTPLEAIQAIASRGYATDPNYVASIARVLAGQNIDPRSQFRYTPSTAVSGPPGPARITSSFGMRGGRMHEGIDIAGTLGEPIGAAWSGRVDRAQRVSGYGLLVDVEHSGGIITRYAHLSAIHVREGDDVAMGERIGLLGNSGRSTGPHLHYEYIMGGTPRDPVPSFRTYERSIMIGRRPVPAIPPTPPAPPRPSPRPAEPTIGQRIDSGINTVMDFLGFGDSPPPAATRASPTFIGPQTRR